MNTARTRILSIFAALLLARSGIPAQADQTSAFTGLRISRARADISGIRNDTTMGGAIVVGFATPGYRLSLDLMRHAYAEVETRGVIAGYDRLWAAGNRMTLFAGVHAGVADLEPDAPDLQKNPYASGVAGGGQAGVMLRLFRNVQLETGIRHTRFDIKTYSKVHERDLRLHHQTEGFLLLKLASD